MVGQNGACPSVRADAAGRRMRTDPSNANRRATHRTRYATDCGLGPRAHGMCTHLHAASRRMLCCFVLSKPPPCHCPMLPAPLMPPATPTALHDQSPPTSKSRTKRGHPSRGREGVVLWAPGARAPQSDPHPALPGSQDARLRAVGPDLARATHAHGMCMLRRSRRTCF